MKHVNVGITSLVAAFAFIYLVPPAFAASATDESLQCAPDNGGITLPEGFCAVVVADDIGTARHLTVRHNGDIYVALRSETKGGGIVALRDTDDDGQADTTRYFGNQTGTGIAIDNGYLYMAPTERVVRYQLKKNDLVPESTPQTIVESLPQQREHSARAIAFDGQGNLYINIGAPSNSCQKQDRAPHSPGMKPCPLLKKHGGIWRFKADTTGQTQSDGKRFATGMRNVIALAFNSRGKQLYGVQMGRDQLHGLWPEKFSVKQSVQLPAEEFLRIDQGDNFGWPYCYYDQHQDKRVLAPEYGGDGDKTGDCGQYETPIEGFPGHWAPEALLFYTGEQFPERYRGGAFIAFHGSWNRAPRPQKGYKVVFVPFKNGEPGGEYKTFAGDFAGTKTVQSPGEAKYRPMGLAQGPDGSLYIADSQQGRVWRVIYKGADMQDAP